MGRSPAHCVDKREVVVRKEEERSCNSWIRSQALRCVGCGGGPWRGRSPAGQDRSGDVRGWVVKGCGSSQCLVVRGVWRWPMEGSIT